MSKQGVTRVDGTRREDIIEGHTLPGIQEVDRLKLHNLVLQEQLATERLNILVLQFLQTEQPKGIQKKIEDLRKQVNVAANQLYASTGIDPQQFQFNVETGEWVLRSAKR